MRLAPQDDVCFSLAVTLRCALFLRASKGDGNAEIQNSFTAASSRAMSCGRDRR